MILQIDSAGVQQAVQAIVNIVTQFLPKGYNILAPAISALVTLITAATIRAIERGAIKKKHRAERQEVIQAYLKEDSAALAEVISKLQHKKNENTK